MVWGFHFCWWMGFDVCLKVSRLFGDNDHSEGMVGKVYGGIWK